MADLTINVPDDLTSSQRQQIADFFRTRTESDWIIFKQNFSAFISSLKKVCANFWDKICTWATNLWHKIFG